jgi:hypothetical protein
MTREVLGFSFGKEWPPADILQKNWDPSDRAGSDQHEMHFGSAHGSLFADRNDPFALPDVLLFVGRRAYQAYVAKTWSRTEEDVYPYLRILVRILSKSFISRKDLASKSAKSYRRDQLADVNRALQLVSYVGELPSAGPKPDQGSPRRFQPSVSVIAYVRRGIRAYIETAQTKREQLLERYKFLDSSEVSSIFSDSIEETFATIAHNQIHGIYPREPVTRHGRFNLRAQHAMLDSFPIRPDEYSDFLEQLRTDIFTQLRNGAEIAGSWGRLKLTGSEIVFDLAQDAPRPEKWELAKLVEND